MRQATQPIRCSSGTSPSTTTTTALAYTEVLAALTTNKNAMTDFIAEQVHGNSLVAAAKLKWVNWAIRCAMLAVASTSSSNPVLVGPGRHRLCCHGA